MNQKNTIESARFVPLAMALVLFFVLGAVAFVARAEELLSSDAFKEEMQENMEERRALYEEQLQERKEQFEEHKQELGEEVEAFRNSEGSEVSTPDAISEMRKESRELFEENKEERQEMYQEHRDEMQSTFQEQKEELQARLLERKQDRQERIDEYKARLSVQQQARLSGYAETMAGRMDGVTSQLEDVATRIQQRIEKIEEMHGVDLTEARDALAEAEALISELQEDMNLFEKISVDTFTSEDPKGQMEEVREAMQLVKDSVKAVHLQLQKAVENIKASIVTVVEKDDQEVLINPVNGLMIEHDYSDGEHTYSGTWTTPTPCHSLETMAIVAESHPEQVTIDVTVTDDSSADMACTQVEKPQNFSVQVSASEQAKLVNVRINGEHVNWVLN